MTSTQEATQQALIAEHKLEGATYVVGPEVGMTYQIGKLPYAALIDQNGILRAKGLVNSREHLDSLFEAEHLGSADAAIVAARRRLIGEARALVGGAEHPSGLDAVSQRVRSGSAVLPADAESWVDATADIRAADSKHYVNS